MQMRSEIATISSENFAKFIGSISAADHFNPLASFNQINRMH